MQVTMENCYNYSICSLLSPLPEDQLDETGKCEKTSKIENDIEIMNMLGLSKVAKN